MRQEPLAVRPPDVLQRVGAMDPPPAGAGVAAGRAGRSSISSSLGNYHYGGRRLAVSLKMTALAVAWAVVAMVCEWFVERSRRSMSARFVWGTLDSLILLVALAAGGRRRDERADCRLSAC